MLVKVFFISNLRNFPINTKGSPRAAFHIINNQKFISSLTQLINFLRFLIYPLQIIRNVRQHK